jgi:hypothetical protein
MSVKLGETLTVTNEAEGGWYVCTTSSGVTGYVPAGFVERKKVEAVAETKEEVGSPKKSKEGTLKKRLSKKKLSDDGSVTSPRDKTRKKKEKTKEGATESKKMKKTKKNPAELGTTVSDSLSPISSSPPEQIIHVADSSSPRLSRPLPTPTSPVNGQTANGAISPPFGPVSASGSISPRESTISASTTSPRGLPLQRAASAVPLTAGQHPSNSNGSHNASSTSPPASSEKKTPPAIPQKRLSNVDPLRASPKSAAEPPSVPKRPAFLSDAAAGDRVSVAKANVPLPPPRGGRVSGGPPPMPHVPGLPVSVSSPRLMAHSPSLSSISESSTHSAGGIPIEAKQPVFGSPSTSSLPSSPAQSHTRSSSNSIGQQDKVHTHERALSSSVASSSDSIGMISSKSMSSMSSIPSMKFEDEKDQRRYFIVGEMLTTERSYVAGLEEGVNKYLRPLLEAAKQKAPNSVEDVKTVFSVMEHLLPLNQSLLTSLEERVLSWSQSARIGDVIGKFAPFLKMYTTYSNNYDQALQTLNKLAHEPFFAELGISHRNIENIIITPIQRIPRYNLLLTELLANTKLEHVDQVDIVKSLAVVKDVADHVNKGVGIYKNVARLTEAGLAHLLAPHRTLVKDGTITVVKASTEKKSKFGLGDRSELKKHSWHFLLFSDVLVFLNVALDENLQPKKEKKSTLRLKLMDTKAKERKETLIPLDLIWLLDPGLRTGFDLMGPHQTMHLYFATAAERDEWWQILEAQVKFTLEKTDQLVEAYAASPATQQTQRSGKHYFTPTDWYDGVWESGKIQGVGQMNCAGAVYEGTFDGSYENGHGSITYPTGMKYTGEWKSGKPAGSGTMVYPAGETYVGEFVQGKRHGRGVLRYKDGSALDVEWRTDVPNGTGSLTTLRFTYTGPFLEGKFFGAGLLVRGNARYDGAFKDNARNGRGKMIYEDGSSYEGEWKDDQQHGSGKWLSTDGSASYEGEFKCNAQDGRGLMKWASGDEYIGNWFSGRPHGSGVFTYKSGSLLAKYDGELLHGKRHGKGTATYLSGARYEGEWADDQPHGLGRMAQANGVTIDGRWTNGIADPKSTITVKGAPITPSATSANPDSPATSFPQHPEIPLIPNFDTVASVFFAHPQ